MVTRLSELLECHAEAIQRIVTKHHGANPRVFGSVLRSEDREGSDLDLLVEPGPATTLFDLGAMSLELEALLGVPVDVVTPGCLPERWRASVLAEARPIRGGSVDTDNAVCLD